MGCITSTSAKTPPETATTPQQVQINIIGASKTPSFASSISAERQQVNPTASNCASPSVVDGLTSVAMARSVSCSGEFDEEEENVETGKGGQPNANKSPTRTSPKKSDKEQTV